MHNDALTANGPGIPGTMERHRDAGLSFDREF